MLENNDYIALFPFVKLSVVYRGNNFCSLSKAGLLLDRVYEELSLLLFLLLLFVIVLLGIPVLEYSASLLPFVKYRVIVLIDNDSRLRTTSVASTENIRCVSTSLFLCFMPSS